MRRGDPGYIDWSQCIDWDTVDALTPDQLQAVDEALTRPAECLCRPTWRCQLHTLP